jgi:hypothetical protein
MNNHEVAVLTIVLHSRGVTNIGCTHAPDTLCGVPGSTMQFLGTLYNLFTSHIDQQLGAAVLAVAVVLLTAVLLKAVGKQPPPGPKLLLPLIGDTLAVKNDPCGYFVGR